MRQGRRDVHLLSVRCGMRRRGREGHLFRKVWYGRGGEACVSVSNKRDVDLCNAGEAGKYLARRVGWLVVHVGTRWRGARQRR